VFTETGWADFTDVISALMSDAAAVRTEESRNVRVGLNSRGEWEIALPDLSDPVTCKTLREARSVAHSRAAELYPCEIIFYDAYYRVLSRERPPGTGS
jgi:hypothetical protein